MFNGNADGSLTALLASVAYERSNMRFVGAFVGAIKTRLVLFLLVTIKVYVCWCFDGCLLVFAGAEP